MARVTVAPEDITVGMDVTFVFTITGPITAITPIDRTVQAITITDPVMGTQTVPAPRTSAVLDAYPGAELWRNVPDAPHRTWWTRASTGSIWFTLRDGTYQCETGALDDVPGMILTRDEIGGTYPWTPPAVG